MHPKRCCGYALEILRERAFLPGMTWRERIRYYLPRAAVFLLAWVAVWLVLTAHQYIMVAATAPPRRQVYLAGIAQSTAVRSLLWIPFTFIVVWAFRAWPIRGPRALGSTLRHLALSIVLMLANHVLRVLFFTGFSYARVPDDLGVALVLSFNGVTATDIGIYWAIVGVLALKAFAQREDALELRSAHLQTSLALAELRALKYQLKPHFVFNSLNAVSALIREERYGKAIDTLADLSMMMRTLSDAPAHERIPLQQEIEFIRHLLAIEQVRFGDKLQVRIEVEPSVEQALVPNLVLQPLVENAIKHGVSKRVRSGRVTVLARATPDRRSLRLQVLNDGPRAVRLPEGTAFSGVGLSATHSRLQHLYGGRFSLKLDLEREEDASAEVVLPLEFPPAP